ncbi:MAG: hypothetical protein JXR96_20885 [Deltaproteobacteria bacterium]|nr:hypothetical protein [Deltaproteobacteria bacterium]
MRAGGQTRPQAAARVACWLALCLLAPFGCSQGGGAGDGGGEDGQAGRDGGDAAGGADVDLEGGFGILVPEGCQLCSMCGRAGDALGEYLHKGRISLRPGLQRLPREQDSVEVEWIESLELGPSASVAAPVSAGRFERSLQGSAQDGVYRYTFTQGFDLDGAPVAVSFRTDFEVTSGRAVEPLRVLDLDTLSVDAWNAGEARFEMRAVWQDPRSQLGEVHQAYSTCRYDLFSPVHVDVAIEGGDRLQLDYRCPPSGAVIVILSTVCPCPLVSAVFDAGGEQRRVEDHFRLVFSSTNHCNLDQSSLVVLDEPLGAVAAIRVPGGAYDEVGGYPPTWLEYLDAAFEPVERREISNWSSSR